MDFHLPQLCRKGFCFCTALQCCCILFLDNFPKNETAKQSFAFVIHKFSIHFEQEDICCSLFPEFFPIFASRQSVITGLCVCLLCDFHDFFSLFAIVIQSLCSFNTEFITY